MMNARIALVICSVGRAEIVSDLLPWIVRQTVAPSHIVFVVTKPEDLPVDEVQHLLPEAQILISEKGLPRQRNMGLDAVQAECEAVFFIDDDYFPAEDAIEGIGGRWNASPPSPVSPVSCSQMASILVGYPPSRRAF